VDGLLEHGVSVFLGFFAIMNPIANTPVFVGLTSDLDSSQQKSTAYRALLISFIIIVVFSVLGKAIFTMFGITLPALRITGGILVFFIGYQMLHGESSDLHKSKTNGGSDISVSPLAVPILAGPGTISTAMNYAAAGGWLEIIITISAFAFLCIITYLFFISGQRIVSFIGSKGISIVTRVMGLILAVIGTQLVIAGVYDAVREFNQI
jgi:multiple antibiotic resistance protein